MHISLKEIGLIGLFALVGWVFTPLAGQPFPCDGRLIISTNKNETTTISYHLVIPFGPKFFSPLANYYNGTFDALGFNSKDNYIYGVKENTNAIFRLKYDNTFELVGVVPMVDTLISYAGDCTPDGLYLCYDAKINQLLVFNVVDNFELIDRINLFWDPSSPNTGPFRTQIFDFAIDPNNPTVAYSYQGNFDHDALNPAETRGYTLRINLDFTDPNLGMVTPVAPVDNSIITHIGGLLFAPNSSLYGFGTSNPGLNPIQDKFFSINPFSGEANDTRSISPKVTESDGCSCPYSFTFINLAPQNGIQCNNDENSFLLTITNNSFNDIQDIILYDTFPEGMLIEEINGNFDGTIDGMTGVGSRYLTIKQLRIPSKSVVEITIKVSSIDVPVGLTYNQAFLKNLPQKFGGIMPSRDPWTGEASRFSVFPPRIDDIEWEITQPSDCLKANDAKVKIKSPIFIPETEYEIRMRNKVGWEEMTWDVVIDNQNSILLDSLIPGNYEVFYIRSKSDNCSVALKDTTIIIEPPNEQLLLTIDNNGPLCEGDSLQLRSTIFPAGVIRWTGPNLFASADANPTIPAITPESGGKYNIKLTYGYCKKFDTTSVKVLNAVKAAITGKTEFCERDSMLLNAMGNGDSLSYFWTGPNGFSATSTSISNPSIAAANAGTYEVIISNGGCLDTAEIQIKVLPTPTIVLPDLIITDYCDPVLLEPVISEEHNLAYSWFPREGLSCSDCPTPVVIPVVQSAYNLTVENEYMCSDSARVNIRLDEDKLILAPNVFRPNSTGKNNHFKLFPQCIINQILNLKIYDRWGNIVFSDQRNGQNGNQLYWDGFIRGQSGFPGVYIWKAEVELVNGRIIVLTGDVTLLP